MNKAKIDKHEYWALFWRLNGHSVGIILKELVRRAIIAVRKERQHFEIHGKVGYSGKMDDVFTSADKKAQEVYIRSISECFPRWGVIAEEDSLRIPCVAGYDIYITIDPIDGTKAFIRGQSHGVGTMIALVHNSEVISAWVGDINTQEIYGYRPGSGKVHRITEYENSEDLNANTKKSLREGYVLLREKENRYSPLSKRTVGRFKNLSIDSGSIGIWLARLWKGEVSGVLIPPQSAVTPWDFTPVYGITNKLGYVFLRPNFDGTKWKKYKPDVSMNIYSQDFDTLIIHRDNLTELKTWVSSK